MKTTRLSIVNIVAIVAIAAALIIPNAEASVLWESDLGKGSINISIINEYGSIHLVPSPSSTMTISGSNGKITLSESPSGQHLSVIPPEDHSRPTDIKVMVPLVSQLNVTTLSGVIVSDELSEMPMFFETKTGHITIAPQPTSNFDVSLKTSGEITVDFSIKIEQRWNIEPSKTGHITIGEGGVPMILESRRGNLSVLRR